MEKNTTVADVDTGTDSDTDTDRAIAVSLIQALIHFVGAVVVAFAVV